MDSKGQRGRRTVVALIVVLMSGAGISPQMAEVVQAAQLLEAANGIVARIHTSADIEAFWTEEVEGKRYLNHPAVGRIELLTGVNDPRLRRQTDAFAPFEPQVVTQALADIAGFETAIQVEVFILPTPPVAPMSSYAQGSAIFLAPGFAPVAPATVAYITTHEMGHILTTSRMDPFPARWRAYCQLRGIEMPSEADAAAAHADRPREILAEDIRFLFGGPLARASGSIENRTLALPTAVDGLADLLVHFFAQSTAAAPTVLAGQAYPNPCNPSTTITMNLPVELPAAMAATAELEIYDLGGRRVRRIQGGRLENGQLSIRWRGSDDTGRTVGSGRYLYQLKLGTVTAHGAVTVVR